MANIAIFRINYKSDFILTLNSDAGWMTPFCIKFWTGAPSQAYFAGYDGTTYTHCAPVAGEPTKLLVQFDDHHLPIGDLKFQIGYHFTVADFPTSVEDEVINQASVIIEVDGAPAQVMLDFNGETAPEIEFSLPAYANEAQRIENEQQRIENEQQRVNQEASRVQAEAQRVQAEQGRVQAEEGRVREFGQMKGDLEQATRDAAAAAENANEKGIYAKNQGDYAKQQGDYAKQQGDTAKADHERAEEDHRIAGEDHTQAGSDHTRAGEDHTQAGSDHTRAAEDHTRAGDDHTRADQDHTRAESDHAAVEVYVDSLGAFDISAYHATGGVLAKYANLTAALGTNGANIPDALRKGGMSVKFVQSSDNNYVQFRFMLSGSFTSAQFTNPDNWQGVDEEPTAGSQNLVKSTGVYGQIIDTVQKNNSVNLFNKADSRIQINKFISGSGIITVDGFRITHPIYVKANTVIKVPYNGNFGGNTRLMYADNGQQVISTLETDGSNPIAFLYQIPRGGYVLINYYKSQQDTLMVCVEEDYPNTYVPFYSKIEEGVDFSDEQKEYIANITDNKANLVLEPGKNLFNKSEVINGYYVADTGTLPANASSAVSPKIEITPGYIYHISRPSISGSGAIRFLDENDNPLKPLRLDGTEWTHYDLGESDYGNTYKECKCKAPATAKYIQFTVIFVNNGSIDNTQLEVGPDFTGYESYQTKKVLPYIELPNELVNQLNNLKDNERIINIDSSDKIGVFSTSFMNGYCMKNHHHINNLSMFLDYIFYNYGHSGDDELENLDKLEQDLPWLGVIPPSRWNIKYGIVMHQDNSGALKSANSDTIYENSKKLANAIKSLGGIPIFSTEQDKDYTYYQGEIQLCNEEGYMFMHWGSLAQALYNNNVFPPFWYNGHPSTRTGWMITNGMLPYLQSLPRPTQCIKLFRVRGGIDTTNLQNLVFEDTYTRAQRYIELTCGVSALTQATEKYFDRLDAQGKAFADINDEYQYIQKKQAVSFGNFAMINLILPYTKVGLSNLVLYFKATGVTNVYVQKIREISNPLPAERYIAFGITEGAELIEVGDTFEVTGGVHNDNIKGTYTVSGIINGMLVTTTSSTGKTTSGTDNPVITSSSFDVSSVTLSGSYDYPSYDYMSRYKEPLGEWIEITSEQLGDGGFNLNNYIGTCVNLDSIAILLKGSGISMSDIFAKVSGTELKASQNIPMAKYQKGESLITDSLLDNNTSWDGIQSIATYDNTQTVSTVSASYELLPAEITTVKEFQQGQSITQSVLSSVLNNNNAYGEPVKVQVRVIARYFPSYVNSDAKWATSEVTEQSFDVARLAICFGRNTDSTNPTKVSEFNVGAWWNEFIINTYCIPNRFDFVKVICTDKKVQVAKIEIVKIQ